MICNVDSKANGINNVICLGCTIRNKCLDPCQILLTDLQSVEVPPYPIPLISQMLIERIFPEMPREESLLQKERRLRKERKARGRAINKLIDYFSAITKEKGKSLHYFFIWRMIKEEKLSHREVSEIMGVSRQRVSQIMNIIEGKSEKGN